MGDVEPAAGEKIVHRHHLSPCLEQSLTEMRSDEAGALCHEGVAGIVAFNRHYQFRLERRTASSEAAGRVVSSTDQNAKKLEVGIILPIWRMNFQMLPVRIEAVQIEERPGLPAREG
jgi:hypothetical protein